MAGLQIYILADIAFVPIGPATGDGMSGGVQNFSP